MSLHAQAIAHLYVDIAFTKRGAGHLGGQVWNGRDGLRV